MHMPNRRSVLMGMGALAAGGGAVMGSGAFTSGSTTLTRGVEVNVISESDVPDDAVDILVDVGSYNTDLKAASSLNTGGTQTTTYEDETTLFPTSGDDGDYNNIDLSSTDGYVSLVSNDVGLVFGPQNSELLPNSKTTFNNLFALTTNNTTETFTVDFDLAGTQNFTVDVAGTDIVSSTHSETGIQDETRELTAAVHTQDAPTSGIDSEVDDMTISIST